MNENSPCTGLGPAILRHRAAGMRGGQALPSVRARALAPARLATRWYDGLPTRRRTEGANLGRVANLGRSLQLSAAPTVAQPAPQGGPERGHHFRAPGRAASGRQSGPGAGRERGRNAMEICLMHGFAASFTMLGSKGLQVSGLNAMLTAPP